MRHPIALAIASLLIVASTLPAQERISLPPPDSDPPGGPVGPPPSGPPQPFAPPPGANPPPPGPPPFSPYAPPGGVYGAEPPPYPRPLFLRSSPDNPVFWIGFEGLLWWTKNQPLPVPLVTTGPASQGANAGNLGAPGTVSLNGSLDNGLAGGVRGFAGCWLNAEHTVGLDGTIFGLDRQSTSFGVSDHSGNGSFVINEPVAGAPFITQVSAPGVATGSVVVGATSLFAGGDFNVLYNLFRANGVTVNLLGGYRYLELDETLNVAGNSEVFTTTTFTDNAGNVLATAPPGSTILVVDQFRTQNQFNGGQVGTEFQYMSGRWSVVGTAKLGIGDTHEIITVNGTTTVTPLNGQQTTLGGGNFATLQIGRYMNNRFALAPEGQLSVGYQITPWLRTLVGYDYLFLSSVARPGNQIDNTFDGVTHPLVPLASSTYWVQGLTLSLQFNF